MGTYLGDFTTSNTVYVYFNTFDSNDPSASVTITGLAVTDIEIYKDGSAIQRSSDAGYTLLDTDGIDFDGITGIHGFSVDLSDNTDAGFYADGSEYTVIVSAITVDAATVSFVAAHFSIGRLARANVTQISGDATAADNAEAFFDGTGYAGTGNVIPTVTAVTNDVGITATAVDAVWDEVLTGATHNVVNSAGRRLRQIEASFVVATGTAQAGAAGSITLEAGESSTNDIFAGDRVIIVGGTGAGEHGLITTYNGTTKVATMSQTWVITPDNTSEYELVPADCDVETWQHNVVTASAGTPDINVQSIDDIDAPTTWKAAINAECDTAISDASLATATALATVDTNVDSILADTGTDGVALATGAISSLTYAAGAIDAAALNADAVDEIFDETIGDGTLTLRETLRVCIATLAGKISGAATTTVTIRNDADTANVVVATVDADGNRSAVTLTP